MVGKEAYPTSSQKEFGEKCAVFGLYNRSDHLEVGRITADGLHALQHRGQEGSGIATSDGSTISIHKRKGLVKQVYDDEDPASFNFDLLPGNMAIGHNRYATSSKKSSDCHLQPVIDTEKKLTLVHNGNLPDTEKVEKFLETYGINTSDLNDSEMMHAAILHFKNIGASLDEAVVKAIPLFKGAFSLLAMDNKQIVVARDERGLRPFSIGALNGGYVFSSETCALDAIGARYIRDINPGEMITANENGLRSFEHSRGEQRLDIFEFIYFARPDSVLLGKSVLVAMKNLGEMTAKETSYNNADIIIDVPDSGTPGAIGYAQESGIPYEEGLIKNRYTGRTFQRPGQDRRVSEVLQKLNPVREVLHNKRVIVVDDSIVRGTTSRELVRMLRNAGARKIHMRITSPPVKFPDYYGIDTPDQRALIGAHKSVSEICEYIGADSLEFLSYDGMISAIGLPESMLSTSCFTGDYPIDIGKRREEIVYQKS